MPRETSVSKIFKYESGRINLVGFPNSTLIQKIGYKLRNENTLKGYTIPVKGKDVVIPSFPVEYISKRQNFFQRLSETGNLGKKIFDGTYPKRGPGAYSDKRFISFCDDVYASVKEAKAALEGFTYLPEGRSVLRKVKQFEKEFGGVCKQLDELSNFDTFIVNTSSGEITGIGNSKEKEKSPKYGMTDFDQDRVTIEMKKAALNMAKAGKEHFIEGIFGFVEDELSFDRGSGNLREHIEQLGMPIRFHREYQRLLGTCEDYWPKEREEEFDDEFEEEYERSLETETGRARYAEFKQHYNIQGMYPPSLLNPWNPESYVPINFKTKRGERKFLLAGLHSGGKSFFLENLVLASILGQAGERQIADKLIVPTYNNIYYYKNNEDEGGGKRKGKAESEIADLSEIIQKSKQGDLIVVDEFFDSTTADIASALGPEILSKLMDCDATVFVSTHRALKYRELQNKGWTLMSPEHEIIDGRVEPTYRLKKGIPNDKINKRYMKERYKDYFD